MATWKVMLPEYNMVLWDKKRFDITSNHFVMDAYNAKIYALAADYVRLYALWNEGGIFLDTDVIVQKNFDEFLEYDFFSAAEWFYEVFTSQMNRIGKYRIPPKEIPPNIPRVNLQAAIMGSVQGHPFLRDCMDWYDDNQYIIKPSKINSAGNRHFECIAPEVYATIAEKYGFDRTKEEQNLSHNMKIFPGSIFASSTAMATNESYAIHCTTGTWRTKTLREKIKMSKFYKKLKMNKFLRKLLGKEPPVAQMDKFDIYQLFYKLRQK
jgi:mannosyltransferase OCH1-like enzyme